MSVHELRLPETTRRRLEEFQRRVRVIKIAEGILAGMFGLAVSYIAVFTLDRFVDTPAVLRAAILIAGSVGFGVFFPLKCHRWVWKTRRMEQVATLLKHRFPSLGDQLLGVVELARGDGQLGSSATLAHAAIKQVDSVVKDKDFSDAVPHPRHRSWALIAGIPLALILLALIVVPAAGTNAFARWLTPWRDVDRYTFAQIEALPDSIVVPHGEEFSLAAELANSTEWSPSQGTANVSGQVPVNSELKDKRYDFVIPPQTEAAAVNLRIGDVRESVELHPAARPELTAMQATVKLPDYLQRSTPVSTDVRGGVISLVKGAVASFEAEVSRRLTEATVSGSRSKIDETRIMTDPIAIADSAAVEFQWKDELGLESKSPFTLRINAVDDANPMIACVQQDPQQVILSTDTITFDLHADDDFGVKQIGLEWNGIEDPLRNPNPDFGEKVVSGGDPEAVTLQAVATFCAETDNVPAQTLEVRAYADDYKPDGGRAYSPTYLLHVMTPADHAIWMAAQLRRWASRADDVYEEEMRLHNANREIRRMNAEELAQPETRRRIEQQAAAERANSNRLGGVTTQGRQLIEQALRNPEMMVGHLETWARALKQLEEIADKRMPSVADLLDEAAKNTVKSTQKPTSPAGPKSASMKSSPAVGNNRGTQKAKPGEAAEDKTDQPAVPQIVDVESGFNKTDDEQDGDKQEQPPSKGGAKLSLPTTVLQGGPKPKDEAQQCPAQEQVDEAVEEQADLLAEFEKIREELQGILDDLENSTFVKRLKSASRHQLEVAASLNRTLFKGFGVDSAKLDARQREQSDKIAEQEELESRYVWTIQSDLEAYFGRKQDTKLLRILDQMEETEVVRRIAELGGRVRVNMSGESISRAEFWADTLDRWAEELVSPSPGGT